MKRLLILSILCATQFAVARTWNHINPIIGDQSFILKYGEAPNEFTPDQVRIAAHLEYAEYVLRSKDVSEMSAEQIQKRTHLLDLLHEYWTRGVFPINADVTYERRPCFIDGNGTICAVGYLVEQTVGHDVAELINERFMYNEILEMNDPAVINWIEECGLTREECAIIQPSYGSRREISWHAGYGSTYRVNDYFYHTFEIMYESSGGNWYRNGRQNYILGVTLDLLRDGNFSTGIKYSKTFGSRRLERFRLKQLLFIQPEAFQYNSVWGMNLRPGGELTRTWGALTLHTGYSYAIPIIEEKKYLAGRHAFHLTLDVNLSKVEINLPKIPRKPKVEEPVDGGNALR